MFVSIPVMALMELPPIKKKLSESLGLSSESVIPITFPVNNMNENCCSSIGPTTLLVGMTINISLRQATEKIDNS